MSTSVYIFDVDGTLYSLKKMHFLMFVKLSIYFLLHPNRLGDLCIIQTFRKFREQPEYKSTSIAELEICVASKLSKDISAVKKVIQKWIFEIPLQAVQLSAYKDIKDFINSAHKDGNIIVIYSDYPVEKKLEILEIQSDYIFCSEDDFIQELKPSNKAMNNILNKIGIPSEKCIYIGDRYSKDGISASLVNIKYIDIHIFRKLLKKV